MHAMMAKLVAMSERTMDPDRGKKELTPGEVISAVKISLATADLDGRIAWAILKGLQKALLAGPWEEVGEDWWQRHTHDGKLVAAVWWGPDNAGKITGAWGRLGRGHWHPSYAKDEAAFPNEPVPEVGVCEAQSFPTMAVARVWMDNKLQQLGWALVPPFGKLP